jgi:hypothetical protein
MLLLFYPGSNLTVQSTNDVSVQREHGMLFYYNNSNFEASEFSIQVQEVSILNEINETNMRILSIDELIPASLFSTWLINHWIVSFLFSLK